MRRETWWWGKEADHKATRVDEEEVEARHAMTMTTAVGRADLTWLSELVSINLHPHRT